MSGAAENSAATAPNEGEAAIRAAVESAPEAEAPAGGAAPESSSDGSDPPPCPITPLGRRGGSYFYLSPAGELLEKATRDHNRLGILGLFDGRTDWLAATCPAYDKAGKPTGGWVHERAAGWLMRACAEAGIWDPATPVRGPGVWRDTAGRLVVHVGDALLIEGALHPVGAIRDGTLYTAAPRLSRPAKESADKAAGLALLDRVRRWRFESPIGSELILGFIGAAMLGGAPPWRVHVLVIGRRGTGKSWLADLVTAALGGGAVAANNVTEAGIRQTMTGEARTVVLDESEEEEHAAHKIQAVIHLLRLMSSGAGARVMRGSAGGKAQAFSVTGCAFLAAILPPALKPQDRSRITVVRLDPLPAGPEHVGAADHAQAAIEETQATSPALRARAIHGWPRFLDTFTAYRAAFMAKGVDPRDADRIGTLLAGRDLLTEDHVPDSDTLEQEVERFRELVEDAQEQEDEGEGEQCLTHLYTSPVNLWRGGEQRLVAETVMEACSLDASASSARRELQKIGLRLENAADLEGRALLVANQHTGLVRIFRDTRWARGAWQQALRYVPGAYAWPKPERFAGARARAVAIPADALPQAEPNGTGNGGGNGAND